MNPIDAADAVDALAHAEALVESLVAQIGTLRQERDAARYACERYEALFQPATDPAVVAADLPGRAYGTRERTANCQRCGTVFTRAVRAGKRLRRECQACLAARMALALETRIKMRRSRRTMPPIAGQISDGNVESFGP